MTTCNAFVAQSYQFLIFHALWLAHFLKALSAWGGSILEANERENHISSPISNLYLKSSSKKQPTSTKLFRPFSWTISWTPRKGPIFQQKRRPPRLKSAHRAVAALDPDRQAKPNVAYSDGFAVHPVIRKKNKINSRFYNRLMVFNEQLV